MINLGSGQMLGGDGGANGGSRSLCVDNLTWLVWMKVGLPGDELVITELSSFATSFLTRILDGIVLSLRVKSS